MGSKKNTRTAAKPASSLTPEVAAQVNELRNDANQLYLKKDYMKAIETFEQAIKLVPDGSSEKTEFLQKKAGCYMNMKRYKDAVKECTAIIDQQPSSVAALKTRAKAYEQMGFYKQALSDVQAINKSDNATDETRESERRLKETMSANRNKVAMAASNGGAAAAAQQLEQQLFLTFKCTLGNETKLVHTSLATSYADLLDGVRAKFPNAGPFVLKYTDKDGDAITITQRSDIQQYLSDVVAAHKRQVQAQRGGPMALPLRLQVVPVDSQSLVPVPPLEELQAKQEFERELQRIKRQESDAQQQQQPQQVEYEMDEWLLEFARTFSDVTGIDPAAHHEHLNLGADKLQKAMDQTLADERALPMFDKAADHFRDATCSALIQWGNVHIVKADRLAQTLLKSGKSVEGEALAAMLHEYDETEKRVNQALAFKPDSWEAIGSLAQLEWERLKAKIGYISPVPPPAEEGKTPEEQAQAASAAAQALLLKHLQQLQLPQVQAVQPHMDKANELFVQAIECARATDAAKKKEKESAADKQPEAASEQQQQQSMLMTPTGNMLVMHGNVLYEWSQVMAAVSQEWRPILDTAVDKFRQAGAAEADIRAALKNHTQKDQLDLGPDPEPEPVAAKEAEDDKSKQAPEAKGLPSLEVRNKKKAGAEAGPAAPAAAEEKPKVTEAKGLPSLSK